MNSVTIPDVDRTFHDAENWQQHAGKIVAVVYVQLPCDASQLWQVYSRDIAEPHLGQRRGTGQGRKGTFDGVIPGFSTFDRVIPGFTTVDWVILSFSTLGWVIMGFHTVDWVIMGFHTVEWVIPGFHTVYWVILGFIHPAVPR